MVGGTPSGVACAVRAAREGCSVLLVQHNHHIGGMMANGLMQWDALYGGHRAPLFTELLRNIERHYIATYGENSRDHQAVRQVTVQARLVRGLNRTSPSASLTGSSLGNRSSRCCSGIAPQPLNATAPCCEA